MYISRTQSRMDSQASAGIYSSGYMAGAYEFMERMLKTIMKVEANTDSRASSLMLLMTAWNTFDSRATPTKYSNRWITYHSMPKKLPRIAAITKPSTDRKPP